MRSKEESLIWISSVLRIPRKIREKMNHLSMVSTDLSFRNVFSTSRTMTFFPSAMFLYESWVPSFLTSTWSALQSITSWKELRKWFYLQYNLHFLLRLMPFNHCFIFYFPGQDNHFVFFFNHRIRSRFWCRSCRGGSSFFNSIMVMGTKEPKSSSVNVMIFWVCICSTDLLKVKRKLCTFDSLCSTSNIQLIRFFW